MKHSKLHTGIRIIVVVLTAMTSSFAQTEKLVGALKYYQAGNIDSAKIFIDAAADNSQTGKDAYTWYLRGFIYKNIYNKTQKQNKTSPARIEALRSFKISFGLDVNKENLKENTKNADYLATTFKNDVVDYLNSFDSVSLSKVITNHRTALENWGHYKEAMLIVDPATNFMKDDIQINLGIARLFQNACQKDSKLNAMYLDTVEKYFGKVLAVDPSNADAYYGMAIAFYNQGADIVNNTDYDIDLVALDKIQNNAKDLFVKSLPYMEKAYQLEPTKEEVIKGLCGIYYVLNDEEKSLKFQCKRFYTQ